MGRRGELKILFLINSLYISGSSPSMSPVGELEKIGLFFRFRIRFRHSCFHFDMFDVSTDGSGRTNIPFLTCFASVFAIVCDSVSVFVSVSGYGANLNRAYKKT